jgi:hypothetical protein
MGQVNVLTPGEVQAGYQLLFNGTDFTGWKSFHKTLTPASWKVTTEDDHKVIEVNSLEDRGHIFTKDSTFQDFDLKVEWNVSVAGNSGIFIRYREDASNSDDWGGTSGPEAQVVDVAHSDGQKPLHRAGTCYDLFPLNAGADNWWKPAGQWNQFRIIAHKGHVAHYGNGKKLLEYEMLTPAWTQAFEASKYRTQAVYKTIHRGAIYLQHHGELHIKYRSLRIKKLTTDPWAKGSQYLKADGLSLVDALTFDDNLFPPVGIALPNTIAPPLVDVSYRNEGLNLRFPATGDYTIGVFDMAGKHASTMQARNTGSYFLPIVKADNGKVFTVSRSGKTLHSGLIEAR